MRVSSIPTKAIYIVKKNPYLCGENPVLPCGNCNRFVYINWGTALDFWTTSKMWFLHLFSLLLIIVVHTASAITPLPPWVQIDDSTCSFVQTAAIKNAFSEMIDIASAAYDTITTARMGQGPRNRRRVVFETTDTYFAIYSIAIGARDRVNRAVGRRF
jgi:hypothetical protein